MDELKMFEYKYKKKRTQYFQKQLSGVNVNTALKRIRKDVLMSLAKQYIKFTIIRDCINIINEDLPNKQKTKRAFNNASLCLVYLCNNFERMLDKSYKKLIN